jgi:hypothetical protein
MIWFVISDCPSVYSRKAELVRKVVPQSRKSSRHTVLVKIGSLSLAIEVGTPWTG